MGEFQHFILTQFNRNLGGEACYPQRLEPGWLKHRFKLFSRFCLPSIQSQTVQDFTWLVCFDPDTPESFRRLGEDLGRQGRFIPVYLTGASQAAWQAAVSARLDPASTHLITTRLDSDDALARDYIAEVQRRFMGQTLHFVNFTRGYILSGGRAYLTHYPTGPFASLIEAVKDFRTVHCEQHAFLSRIGLVEAVAGAPAWVQTVHGSNLINRVRGVRRSLRELTESGRFALPDDLMPEDENSLAFWSERIAGETIQGALSAKSWLKYAILKGRR